MLVRMTFSLRSLCCFGSRYELDCVMRLVAEPYLDPFVIDNGWFC
jgi:hypothetical protein